MKLLCNRCRNQKFCQKPCDLLKQDLKEKEVYQRELTISDFSYDDPTLPESIREPINFTNREIEVMKLLSKGYAPKDIAAILNITSNSIYKIKSNLKKKYNNLNTEIDSIIKDRDLKEIEISEEKEKARRNL